MVNFNMNKQIPKATFKDKVGNYFKFLCGGFKSDNKQAQASENTKYTPSVKKRRLTFALDRALIKLSRKNIIIQEFSSKEQLSIDLQKYISQRLAFANIAIFQGSFTQASMNKVYYPIKLISQLPTQPQSISSVNKIVAITSPPLRKIQKGIDAYVIQVRTQVVSKIQKTLYQYHRQVQNFIFLCEGNFDTESVRELFAVYKQEYMFEVERIMMLDKCVKTMVYISKSGNVLNIDKGSLIQYYIDQLSKRDSFIDKYHFSCLLDALFQANLYVQVASIIGHLMASTEQIDKYDRQFAIIMQEKYPSSIAIVKKQQKWRGQKEDDEISNIPKFYQNTPLFGTNEKDTGKGKFSDTGSVLSRRNALVTHSFAKTISRRMGDWQQQ